MSLDLTKLENARERGGRIIARCPACAELGHDEKAEHLVILPDGRFGCVVYPGASGKDHRKEIFALVGERRMRGSFQVRVRRPTSSLTGPSAAKIVDAGRLGRIIGSPAPGGDSGPSGGLPEHAKSLDGVGRIGRVSQTLALRVSTSIHEDGEEDIQVHTRSVGVKASKASTPSTPGDSDPDVDETDAINASRRRAGLPPLQPLPPDTPRDPETGFPIINGAICPF